MTCTQTIVIASAWVGFTLPGMMPAPRLVLRQVQLADAAAAGRCRGGARRSANLEARDREGAQRAARRDESPRAGERRELVRGGAEREARERRDAAATPSAHLGCVLSPVPTAVPPRASSYSPSERPSRARSRRGELRDPSAELLPEGERRGVHEVGAADLTMSLNSSLLASMPLRRAATAGKRRSLISSAAATCITVGKTSFEDCERFHVVVGVKRASSSPSFPRRARSRGSR